MPTRAERDALVLAHRPLARKIAERIARRLPASVELDDLVSAGTVGLICAAEQYDPARGAFTAYAEWRVKGAILDELRTAAIESRTARRWRNMMERAVGAERAAGREPTEVGVARRMQISVERYHEERLAFQAVRRVPLAEVIGSSGTADAAMLFGGNPEEIALTRDEAAHLLALVRAHVKPDSRDELIMQAAIVGDERWLDVAADLGISESRVSQLHTEAMNRIRASCGKAALPKQPRTVPKKVRPTMIIDGDRRHAVAVKVPSRTRAGVAAVVAAVAR